MKIRVNKKAILTSLPVAYYIGNFLKMYFNLVSLQFLIMSGIGLTGMLLLKSRKQSKVVKSLFVFYIFYFVFQVISNFHNENTQTEDFLTNIWLCGITGIMVLYPWNRKQGAVCFYLIVILLGIRLVGSPRRVLAISSNNYVSILLILASSLYYLPFEWNGEKMKIINVFPAIFSFLLSVLAEGRGGILATAIMMSFIFLVFVFDNSFSKAKRVITFFFGIIIILFSIVADTSVFDGILHLGNFKSEGTDNIIRYNMWNNYFTMTNSSLQNILLGTSLKNVPIIARFGGNPHNSFIYLHAICGIVPVIVFFVFLVRTILLSISKKNYIILIILFTIVIRGMTDKFIFGQYGMPIMVYLLMFCKFEKRINDRKNV